MNIKITCPVCDRSAIEISICPNCQTDLALIRMLSELPLIESKKSNFQWVQWLLGVLISALLLGWGIWVL